MTGISTLSPTSTYPDLLIINNAGQGLNNTPSQLQDGLGNRTNMTISSNFTNFDRTVGQIQFDGVPLTASAATLNSISDVANGEYLLINPNAQLANASTLTANNGLILNLGVGTATIQPNPASILHGIQLLNAGPNGIVVYTGGVFFGTVDMVADATINIVNGDGQAGNPTFNVVTDSCRQRVNVELNGVFESQKSQLNFIPGANIGIVVTDNPGLNRTDITISSTGGGGGGTLPVVNGGTGVNAFTPYAVIVGGTTPTGPLQNVVGVGAPGQVLTSSGVGLIPTWEAPGAATLTQPVTQVAHGLVVGNVIRIATTGNYVVAQADSSADATSVVGIVIAVTDANNFTFQYGGIVSAIAGLTVGDPYFLSPTVAGGYTATLPSTAGQVVLPLFYALSATSALWQPKSAIELM